MVMAPTRELAQQIEEETVKFAHFLVSSCEIVLFISSILCQGENTLMIRILSIYLHRRATRLCILIQIFNNPKPFNQLEKKNITMTYFRLGHFGHNWLKMKARGSMSRFVHGEAQIGP